jgi:hypothetical protein
MVHRAGVVATVSARAADLVGSSSILHRAAAARKPKPGLGGRAVALVGQNQRVPIKPYGLLNLVYTRINKKKSPASALV